MEKSNGPYANTHKRLNRFLIFLGGFVFLILIWAVLSEQSRCFYCLKGGNCITVWKRSFNVCYIIPGKYYGVFKPSENYIKTTNIDKRIGSNFFTIYFTEEMSNTLIFHSESDFEVYNENKQKPQFVDYTSSIDKYKEIIFIPDAKKANDLKKNVNFILLDTKANYATDKNGDKL